MPNLVTKLFARMLASTTDAILADSILGDLEEERRRRAMSKPVQAAAWMTTTVVLILLRTGLTRLAERCRAVLTSGTGGIGDLRQACRGLGRTRWYSITAVGVIALGMSLATTAFAMVDGVLFKPLPYHEPGELFHIASTFSKLPPVPLVTTAASKPDLDAWSAVSAPA